MKEYLTKNKEGGYSLVNHRFGDEDIEVPDGAIIAVHYNRSDKIYFWKDNETHLVGEVWVSCEPNGLRTIESFLSEHKDYCIVVWQRHTQPEEYLLKGADGEYLVVDHDCQGRAIEIPEGAETYATDSMLGNKITKFFKEGFVFLDGMWMRCSFNHADGDILWKRHTQPEELPFVDDGDDQVNHPSHYASGAIECIDAIESSMTKEAFAGYLKGNVQKYMWRYENKGGVESLQKAQWYLNKLILLQSA